MSAPKSPATTTAHTSHAPAATHKVDSAPTEDQSQAAVAGASWGPSIVTKVAVPVAASQEEVPAQTVAMVAAATDNEADAAAEVEGADCSAAYVQCGGEEWTGPTCCVQEGGKEFTCAMQDAFYSQCLCASPILSNRVRYSCGG